MLQGDLGLNDMVWIWQAITGHQVCAHSGHGLVK